MSQQERTREIILQLKAIRKERNLSLQDVHELVLDSGEFTSLSSVKRVFADGSENQNFRYQDTIQPIARAMVGVKEETTTDNLPTTSEVDALKSVVLLKDSIIRDLRRENEELQQRNDALENRIDRMESTKHTEIATIREEAQRKVDYLRKENERKDGIIIRRNKAIAIVASAFGLFMLAIIFVLIIDMNNSEIGWFRHIAATLIGG